MVAFYILLFEDIVNGYLEVIKQTWELENLVLDKDQCFVNRKQLTFPFAASCLV